jgi:hypothetical protein
LGIDTVACVDVAIIGGIAILAVATVYLIITPPDKAQRDIENIGPAIDRFERNFKKNAGAVSAAISDSITYLTADKLDPTKPAENVLPGSLKRKFPTGLLGRSLNEIEEALKKATGKEKSDLKTAKKILEQVKRLLQKPK